MRNMTVALLAALVFAGTPPPSALAAEPVVQPLTAKGVEFRVCRFTLERNRIDPKKVLPEASLVPSGVAEVARLQAKEGYACLRP